MRSHVRAGFLAALFLLAVYGVPALAAGADDGLGVVEAAERQDWEAVSALVDAGADVTATQPDGATALHWAAHWNDAETAGRLIAAGADVDAVNDLGVPPLWIALDSANVDVALRLIEAGADPNASLTTGETMLMTAARHGLGTIVARLLERGADARLAEHERGQTALMWAAAGGHSDVARRLLESGGGVRARTTGRFTALMFAARAGDLETVQLLLEAGADPEARAIDGSTPLLVASRSTDALAGIDWRIIPYASGHEETALYLIERGADVAAADRLGRTALHAAVETNRPRLAGALIEAGADIDARFTNPVAALRGDYISRRPYKGATPFWLAARAANLEMMRLLLDAGPIRLFRTRSAPRRSWSPPGLVRTTRAARLTTGSSRPWRCSSSWAPTSRRSHRQAPPPSTGRPRCGRTGSSSSSSTRAPTSTPRTTAAARRSTWSSTATPTRHRRVQRSCCAPSARGSRWSSSSGEDTISRLAVP